MSKLNLAVLFGSRSCEHDVSVVTALQLMDAVDREQYDVTPVYISNDGLWYTGEALTKIETFREFNPMKPGITRIIPDVTANAGDLWAWPPQRTGLFARVPVPVAHVDCAIPVFHGLNGEDGTIQGLLEMANIPYTSSGVLGSSVGMDKIAVKLLLRGAGLPVLDFVWLTREQLERSFDEQAARIEEKIGYPVFVKPACLGSSIGITRADTREELEKGLRLAASYDRRILAEAAVSRPTEINCAVVGFGEETEASVCEMPVPSGEHGFLDFWEKYLRNAPAGEGAQRGMKNLSRVVPAPVGERLTEQIQTMSREVFRLLDCKGTVRIDFILDERDVLYVNEPNIIPGSMAFYLWKASGLPFGKLIERMVEDAFRAHAEKQKSVYAYDSGILMNVVSGAKGAKGVKR